MGLFAHLSMNVIAKQATATPTNMIVRLLLFCGLPFELEFPAEEVDIVHASVDIAT